MPPTWQQLVNPSSQSQQNDPNYLGPGTNPDQGILGGLLDPFLGGTDPNKGRLEDQGMSGYYRGGQALNALGQTIMNGPSAVNAQAQQALGQGMAQQQALANSQRPGNEALGMRMAMQNSGQLAGQVGNSAIVAKMQEDERRKQLLMQLLQGKRQQDLQATQIGLGQPTSTDKAVGAATGLLSAFGTA